jgi:NADPH:quinone reductase-like Zn-dependent oxidoreductase
MGSITAKAATFDRLGGAEVIVLDTVEVAAPGPGEIRIRINAIGLNRSEAMFRQGFHPIKPVLPSRLGYEAAGVVESVGEGVSLFTVGDRVSTLPVMSLNACGAYGEMFTVPAELAVPSPPELSDEQTAALWSSYMTAYGMIVELVKIEAGDWVLVTAASSSVGPPVLQMLRMQGARVIATTRNRAKVDAIRGMGAEHVIVTGEEDIVARVKEITGGAGVRFSFDPSGGPFVDALAEAAAPYGAIVLYGILDFTPVPLPVQHVVAKNLSIMGYAMLLDDRPERNERAISFIRDGVKRGVLKPLIAKRFALEQIREAAAFLDSMAQVGKVVVVPDHAPA